MGVRERLVKSGLLTVVLLLALEVCLVRLRMHAVAGGLAVLAITATFYAVLFCAGWLACLATGHEHPIRTPFGGFRCPRCLTAFADLDEAGFIDGAYVTPERRPFHRITVRREEEP